jgi:hypothetical protein
MDAATFPVAVRASFDRRAAAMRWADKQFPENAHLVNNARIDVLVREALANDDERNGEDAHVLMPSNDAAVPVGPDADLAAVLRAAAPTYAACDYGDGHSGPVAGLLPLAAPPQIVVLALCEDCLVLLATAYPQAHFIFNNTEGTDR